MDEEKLRQGLAHVLRELRSRINVLELRVASLESEVAELRDEQDSD